MTKDLENKGIITKIEKHGIDILRISLGIIFFWFGFLKYFSTGSAAEKIASETISVISFGLIEPKVSMPLLATIECIIGIGLLSKKYMKYVLPLLYFQMLGTLLPLFIFTEKTWEIFPIVPTLSGQYIIKNLILIAASIILSSIAKGGKLIRNPEVAQKAKIIEDKIEAD